VTVATVAIGFTLAGGYGPRLPSYWMLSGSVFTFAHVLARSVDAVLNGLVLLFVTFICKVFVRREWLAGLAAVGIAFVVEPPNALSPVAASLVIVPIAAAHVYLLLRIGLVPVVVAFATTLIIMGLPLTADVFAPTTAASVLVLCGIIGVALFGFYSTLGGRPLLKLDL
jgi:hypothetical protein